MSRKVTWKKGMRLSAELFDAAENERFITVKNAVLAATGGRCGLYPSDKKFSLSINANGNDIEVNQLCCHGVTRNGLIADIDMDSAFSRTFDTRLQVPQGSGSEAYLLVLKLHPGHWREINETYSELEYHFELVGENSTIDENSLPIGRIVNQYGWRLDEAMFVPPCLFVNAHPMYQQQAARARRLMSAVEQKCAISENCPAAVTRQTVWMASANALVRLTQEADTLTPEQLYGILQSYVYSFVIGCAMFPMITFENKAEFETYARNGYNPSHLYADIEGGLNLCEQIKLKMDVICDATLPEPEPLPQPQQRPQPQVQETEEERRRRLLWGGMVI